MSAIFTVKSRNYNAMQMQLQKWLLWYWNLPRRTRKGYKIPSILQTICKTEEELTKNILFSLILFPYWSDCYSPQLASSAKGERDVWTSRPDSLHELFPYVCRSIETRKGNCFLRVAFMCRSSDGRQFRDSYRFLSFWRDLSKRQCKSYTKPMSFNIKLPTI